MVIARLRNGGMRYAEEMLSGLLSMCLDGSLW